MTNKTIYIATSWKNRHAVELLTQKLRDVGNHTVISFVEKATEDEGKELKKFDISEWIESESGREKFEYDVNAAMTSDIVIYIGPAGTDAWAECGAAFARNVPILGLWAKGDPGGLMRRMMRKWFCSVWDLLIFIETANYSELRHQT